jgi:hypothetical protein
MVLHKRHKGGKLNKGTEPGRGRRPFVTFSNVIRAKKIFSPWKSDRAPIESLESNTDNG